MAIAPDTCQSEILRSLPLLAVADPERVLAWRHGEPVRAAQFLAHVRQFAEQLPEAGAAVNLCEDRYIFLVAFCALVTRGQVNLLPSSRAPQAVAEVMAAHPGSYALGEQALADAPAGYLHLPLPHRWPESHPAMPWQVPAGQLVAIGYTSGSTGKPAANPKYWGQFHASHAGNQRLLEALAGERANVVATVPPQHMYGMEMSVLLPLLSGMSVRAGRPLFPADVAAALAEVPMPRVLVTTPVHLRALVNAGIELPKLAAIVSSTAPLPRELARAAEQRLGAPLCELFGSTETCVFASRRPVTDEDWQLHDGVRLHPQPDGTLVEAPQLAAPRLLADTVTLHDDGRRFRLCGRNTDLLEIAGKRASLGDLTRRLLAIDGVLDGVVCQLEAGDALGVQRIAAVAVAPSLSEHAILEALRQSVDPLFLPRPLRLVAALPRNDTGKLPRQALLELLELLGGS